MAAFMRSRGFDDYHALWRWSTDDLGGFWGAIWEHFEIQADGDPSPVLASEAMPGAVWFPQVALSYAEHVFRGKDNGAVAVQHASELRELSTWTWDTLRTETARIRADLRAMGVRAGDTVAAYMPNIPETLAALTMVGLPAAGVESEPREEIELAAQGEAPPPPSCVCKRVSASSAPMISVSLSSQRTRNTVLNGLRTSSTSRRPGSGCSSTARISGPARAMNTTRRFVTAAKPVLPPALASRKSVTNSSSLSSRPHSSRAWWIVAGPDPGRVSNLDQDEPVDPPRRARLRLGDVSGASTSAPSARSSTTT